jgi:Putative amidase domain
MHLSVRGTVVAAALLSAVALSTTVASASKGQRPHTPTPTPTATAVATVTPTPASTGGYSGAKAAAYANTYWSSYNPGYPSFANQGGDCTNFVSQALYAGGIAMRPAPSYSGNASWFMISSGGQWSYSPPWVNANDNNIFLVQHLPGVTQVASYFGVPAGQIVASHASQGDVVLYDWNNDGIYDHEAIISTTDGQSVDAHTSDRHDQYWTLAQFNTQWATTHMVVLHIPAGTQ